MDAKRMSKAAAMQHWAGLADGQNPYPHVQPVGYKSPGSRYGQASGIRIDGTLEFIDAVLSNLKPLLAGENGSTRLELNYQQVVDRETGLPVETGFVCYVRVCVRGPRARMVNAMFGLG